MPATVEYNSDYYENNTYNVDSIDAHAFSECENLQSIEIASSVKAIGNGAFRACPQLSSIDFTTATGITSLPDSLFLDCYNIKQVTFHDNITTIGSSAFQNCVKLDVLNLPAKLDSLGSSAFTKCSKLPKVTLPKSLTKMGEGVFLDCKNLVSVDFENEFQLTTLPARTFQSCTNLKDIVLPQSVSVIGENAFKYCLGITRLVMNDNTQRVEAGAYSGCTELTTLTIPETLEALAENAFENCDNISQITVNRATPPSATYLTFSANVYDNAMLYVPALALEAYQAKSPWRFFEHMATSQQYDLAYIVDGDTIATQKEMVGTQITPRNPAIKAGHRFSGWKDEPSVMPAQNVQVTGAFNYQLTYQDKDDKTAVYTDSLFYGSPIVIPNESLHKAGKLYDILDSLKTMPACDTIIRVSYYMSERDTVINHLNYHIFTHGDNPHAELMPAMPANENEMVKQYDQTSYTIPATISYGTEDFPVTVIRDHAFRNCKLIKSITIDGSNLVKIGSQAFSGCRSLEAFTLPESVEDFGSSLFYNCTNLTEVTFPLGIDMTVMPENMFQDCSALTEIDLPASLEKISDNAFRGCESLKEIELPENLASIGERAFQGCSKLDTIRVLSQTILPLADESVFDSLTYKKATLYVPTTLESEAADMEPWKNFENMVNGTSVGLEQCAAPEISYANGRLIFTCSTPDAKIITNVTVSDVSSKQLDPGNNNIALKKEYTVTAYAKKKGYRHSDTTKRVFVWNSGDVNGDGEIDALDASLVLQHAAKKIDLNEIDKTE